MSRTVAIVQARMGSRRLPGKVLRPLAGRSMLAYLLERIGRARSLDAVVVATTTLGRDDAVEAECARAGVACFRGSEADVLGRYRAAADCFAADRVVRVTADNPFTDPESIDFVVAALAETGAAYAIEGGLPAGAAGEAVTRELLERMAAEAGAPRWREHVTLYAKEHLEAVGGLCLAPRPGCRAPELRLTVDEPADYAWVTALAEGLTDVHASLPFLIRRARRIAHRFPPAPSRRRSRRLPVFSGSENLLKIRLRPDDE